jgi:glycosyltransferase involved in cell wall biosynthesis
MGDVMRREGVRVDVGIPAFGRPRYVTEAIESVLAQTGVEFHATVSEDGQGGGDVEAAVRRFSTDSRLSYVATGRPVGAAANLSSLVNAGSAPYVALLHDDDLWSPECLSERVCFLDEHPECSFVFSPTVIVNGTGGEIERLRPEFPSGLIDQKVFLRAMFGRNRVSPNTVVARRSAYQAVGPWFDSRFRRIYDYEMWFRLGIRGPVGYLAQWDSARRIHGSQSSFQHGDRGADFVRFVDHAERLLRDSNAPWRTSPVIKRRRLSRAHLFIALNALEQGDAETSRSYLAQALTTYPPTIMDPRTWALVAGSSLGTPGRLGVGVVRGVVRRHGVRIHVRKP